MRTARKSLNLLSKSFGDLKESLASQKSFTAKERQTLDSAQLYPPELHVEASAEELLKKLEPGYYEGRFDAVAFELSQLENNTDALLLEATAERRSAVLEVVGVLLTKHVLMNYAKFVEGIDDVAALEAELQCTHKKVVEARGLLGGIAEDISTSLLIASQGRKKQRAREVMDVAKRLKLTRDLDKDVRRVEAAGDFAQVFWLCAQSLAWMQQLPGLSVSQQLTAKLNQQYSEITSLLGVSLQSACTHFEEDAYERVLEGYLFLSSTESLSSDVTAAFSAAVDAATSACVFEVVSSLPDVDASAAKCTTAFLEWAKRVPPECFCALLQEVLSALLDVLSSHDRMGEYHTLQLVAAREVWKKSKVSMSSVGIPGSIGTASSGETAGGTSSQQHHTPDALKGTAVSSQPPGSRDVICIHANATVTENRNQLQEAKAGSKMLTEAERSAAGHCIEARHLPVQEEEAAKQLGPVNREEALRAVEQGLSQSRRILVEDSARKLHLLLALPAASQPDNVLRVLQMCHQFVVIGDAFSGASDAGNLTDQLAAMSYRRYREVHSANLAALWACLERERWLAVARAPDTAFAEEVAAACAARQHLPANFRELAGKTNPWGSPAHSRPAYGFASQAACGGTARDKTGGSPSSAASTVASNQVLGWLCQYAIMLRVMQPAAVLVTGMFELFEMYLVAVVRNFGGFSLALLVSKAELQEDTSDAVPERLRRTLRRILTQSLHGFRTQATASRPPIGARSTLFTAKTPGMQGRQPSGTGTEASQREPAGVDGRMSSFMGNLGGVQERVVVARSLQTLAQELKASKKALLGLLSQSQASAAEVFFSRTVEAAGDAVDCVMRSGARLILRITQLPDSIAAHDYNLEVPPDASASWVEDLTAAAGVLKECLDQVSGLDPVMESQLWRHALRHIGEVALEGLSRVKGCSAVGRTAMTSDLQDLGYSLKSLLQPMAPDVAAALDANIRQVDGYIKASHVASVEELKRWVQTHPEYSQQQVQALAETFANLKGWRKRERAALVAQVVSWMT